MRPCIQCKKPVENKVFICGKCEAYNEEHGYESPQPPQAYTGQLHSNADMPHDETMDLFMWLFLGCIGLGAALFGYVAAGFSGFLIAGAMAVLISKLFIRILAT